MVMGDNAHYGDDDTCVGYASQRRTPRPQEWGEARLFTYGAVHPPPSDLPLKLYRER